MLDELKLESYKANMLLPKFGLINLTFGNVSVIDREKSVLGIKPSGVSYENLKPEDMVLVDLDGNKVDDGALNPSSDTPTHVRLYQSFDSIGGLVHTHSKFASSFAQAGRPVECYGTTHADYFYGEIPVTRKMTEEEITGNYELETGNVIVERFRDLDPIEYPGVLVDSHGPFAWGPTGEKAVENAVAMELVAEMAYYTLQLAPENPPIDQALLDKHFKRKHGKDAYYGQ
ncbi:MAG: L-ribulose-5-phosphate 4-epimerase [Candidatus Hydrogenedentes bacterium]|nr:L-ribulose-5-phosphate 4-epimerase [Candidatus Hydrogenedentota bacterium]